MSLSTPNDSLTASIDRNQNRSSVRVSRIPNANRPTSMENHKRIPVQIENESENYRRYPSNISSVLQNDTSLRNNPAAKEKNTMNAQEMSSLGENSSVKKASQIRVIKLPRQETAYTTLNNDSVVNGPSKPTRSLSSVRVIKLPRQETVHNELNNGSVVNSQRKLRRSSSLHALTTTRTYANQAASTTDSTTEIKSKNVPYSTVRVRKLYKQ
jgi:hypothetical protein